MVVGDRSGNSCGMRAESDATRTRSRPWNGMRFGC